ncbi:MAG: hypothetical protein KatS3mg005_1279 [Bryobacteraceae bacterium]|nr:MAG: hypothetical protein KatS3mg005_1279 [Bryobacteraceae bacterium]
MSALVRPAYQLLPLVLSLISFLVCRGQRNEMRKRRCWTVAAAPMAGMVVLISLMAWNSWRHGYFGLTWALGWNLCNRTALFVERAGTHWEPLRSALIEARNEALIKGKSHTALQYQWDSASRLHENNGLNSIELAKRLAALNVELIAENPLEYLAAVGRAGVSSLFPHVTRLIGASGAWQIIWSALHFVVIAAWLFQFWIFGGSALREGLMQRIAPGRIAGVASVSSEQRVVYIVLGLIIIYTILINAMVDVGDPRQRSPVDWAIVMQTLIGMEGIFRDPEITCA